MVGENREKAEGVRNKKCRGKVPAQTSTQQGSGRSPWAGGLEVLIMMGEMSPVLPIDELTGLFHILGHARGATAEHPNLPDLLGRKK